MLCKAGGIITHRRGNERDFKARRIDKMAGEITSRRGISSGPESS